METNALTAGAAMGAVTAFAGETYATAKAAAFPMITGIAKMPKRLKADQYDILRQTGPALGASPQQNASHGVSPKQLPIGFWNRQAVHRFRSAPSRLRASKRAGVNRTVTAVG